MTLTKAQNLKGNKFNLVDTIIFDEFIIEDGVHHYLKGEVNSFLGLCETLARTRNFRCFMLANSVTTTNPYFLEFNLSLPYNNDIKTFKDGTILVQYMKNEEYRKMIHLENNIIAADNYGIRLWNMNKPYSDKPFKELNALHKE